MTPLEDTMLLSYVLDAGNNRHNMDTLSELHLKHKTISYKDVVGSGKKQLEFSDVNLKVKATQYAAEDADVTLRLYELLSERVTEEKLDKIYEVFEKPMIRLLSKLELEGVKIDKEHLKKLSLKFQEKLKKLRKKYLKFQKKFNIGSPKQLGEIIYNELKIAKLKKTKKGSLATNAKILEDLALSGHAFPNLILEWRQVSKLKSTYSDALQDHINKKYKKGSHFLFISRDKYWKISF